MSTTVDTLERAGSEPQEVQQLSSLSDLNSKKEWLELYKLEYDLAAKRYDNIYRAIWQNFSYMAALSAGIVAFGSRAYSTDVVAFIALIPLVFWFLATFLPMDRYGENTRDRLAKIEENISNIAMKYLPEDEQLYHFRDFQAARRRSLIRTKYVVWAFGVLITCLAVKTGDKALNSIKDGSGPIDVVPVDLRVTPPDWDALVQSIDAIQSRLESLESSVTAVQLALPNRPHGDLRERGSE